MGPPYQPIKHKTGILSKLRHNTPTEVCLQVYCSIFHSHLIYDCTAWGLTTEENLKKIEVLQKKCIRIITLSNFNSHTNPFFIEMNMLRDIIKFHQLKLVYEFYSDSSFHTKY